MTKVVYVMGSVRSGSTILGVALGNCDGFFYAGELDQWLRKCGKPSYEGAETSAFWSRVNGQLGQYRDLCGDVCFRCLEQSTALLRPMGRWRTRRFRPRYRRFHRDLYNALAEASACDTIVDTAHYPFRARELRKTENVDLYLILLVRNPHAVVESFRKIAGPDGKSLWAANVYLWLTHFLSFLIYLSHPKRKRVLIRAEEFATNTSTTLRKIIDMVGSASPLPDMSLLNTGQPLAGHSLLRSSRVTVTSQLMEPPRRRSLVTGLLQLPWTAAVALMKQ
jgi:hypothetical protein